MGIIVVLHRYRAALKYTQVDVFEYCLLISAIAYLLNSAYLCYLITVSDCLKETN